MPNTSNALFNNADSRADDATNLYDWVDKNNILTENTAIAQAEGNPWTANQNSYWLEGEGPIAADDLPAAYDITDIRCQIRCRWYGSGGPGTARVRIRGGNEIAISITQTMTTFTLNGDPSSYWGLSEAQLAAFIAGTRGFSLEVTIGDTQGGPRGGECEWMKCRMTYEALGTNLPTIF